MEVFPVNERDRDSGLTSTARTTDTVEVGLLIVRDRVVDDVSDIVYVNAACRNISSNQNVFFPARNEAM